MFTTLYAGIRRSQTHTYARSLGKNLWLFNFFDFIDQKTNMFPELLGKLI